MVQDGKKKSTAFRSSIYTFMHELMFAFALNIMKFICASTCGICNDCLLKAIRLFISRRRVGVYCCLWLRCCKVFIWIFPTATTEHRLTLSIFIYLSTPSCWYPFSCKIWYFFSGRRSFIRNTNSKSNLNKPKFETFFKQRNQALIYTVPLRMA